MRNGTLWLGLACFAAAPGCSRPQPAAVAPAPAPAAIALAKPERRVLQRVLEQPGTVQAFEEVTLFAKIPGYVKALATDPDKAALAAHDRLIDIGSRVKKDQLLAELSVPELEEEFHQKEATVRQYEAEVVQSKKALAAAQAGVTSAKAMVAEAKAGLTRSQALYERWQSEAARVGRLVTGGVIDAQTRDETLNQFKAAEAGKAESTAKVASSEASVAKADADADKAVADVAAANAKLDVAKADVRRVDALRGYTRVRAPFDGVVTKRSVGAGDFILADGKHGLVSVARIDPVRVVLQIPEADAGLIVAGQEIGLSFQATPGNREAGRVTRTSWSLEPGSRTLRVEVDLPNATAKLRPGMYAYGRLTIVSPEEWCVPVAAVGKHNDEPAAFLVENGKAVRVAVQVARGDAQSTQVRKYKRPNTKDWLDITGNETFATPANLVADGQAIPSEK